MADEKKPERPGPVVIRKGQLTPQPEASAGAGEPPAPDAAPAQPRTAPPAPEDRRPLWQRVAEGHGAPRPPAPSGGPRPPRGEGRSRPDRADRGGRGGPTRDRPPRRERDHGGDRERTARPSAAAGPALPAGEPPPAPEIAAPDEGSFADMLAGAQASLPRRRFQVGEKVAGKIIQVGPEVTFLELGSGVAEAMIETVELADAEGQVQAREGDIIDAVVVQASDRGVVVSRGRAQKRDHGREALVEAARTGLAVDGVVTGVNKGGLEVEVHGARAFCPVSQIDVRFVGDPASFVGQKLQFKVQRADARDVVLSRRALLEEERAAKARATRERLAQGAVFEGLVTSVQDYGAFVDIGGVEGLVHVSELSWDRVSKPQDLLKAGDTVQVQVVRIDEDPKKGERIGLSVRALTPRPEPAAAPEPFDRLRVGGTAERPARPAPPPPPKVGDVVEASVDKIEPFGVFVRFAGGRGLVPASETGTPRGADLRKAFKMGDVFQALVTAIDEQGRIRLSKSEAEHAVERAEAQEYLARAAPKAAGKGFGTLGDLLRAKLEKK
ncbi:MAG TPA: S1 RNA-binding domain-containing protein [Anaeromyxobacter sp.]|nr:S1 RNA-binding domain-containing protein [Anaeromyxobacter sp.]